MSFEFCKRLVTMQTYCASREFELRRAESKAFYMLKLKERKLKKKQIKFELQENLRLIAEKRVEIQKEMEFRKP